mmetsp:Transcript_30501/g.43256  ORF Transcript_30501/g.43256 Transcript_30501/m.43256 type:complete len:159 (-) Transcript_30501:457-933(-)
MTTTTSGHKKQKQRFLRRPSNTSSHKSVSVASSATSVGIISNGTHVNDNENDDHDHSQHTRFTNTSSTAASAAHTNSTINSTANTTTTKRQRRNRKQQQKQKQNRLLRIKQDVLANSKKAVQQEWKYVMGRITNPIQKSIPVLKPKQVKLQRAKGILT